jgi:hypothetical protein
MSNGLMITKSSSFDITAYSDVDWASCPDMRRSTFGYCVFLGDNLVAWLSKRQHTVSQSSAGANIWLLQMQFQELVG